MMKFYFNLSPNPMKVALALEEMGLTYEACPVDTRAGDQFGESYLALNPNGKVPTLVDGDATVFDSNAILLYLGEKTGQFMAPGDAKSRGDLLSWLMFVATGVGPFSGQAVHFKHFAPEAVPYARTRYLFEADRHFGILNDRLRDRPYVLGETYTVVDMAVWGWARMLPFVLGDEAWAKFPNVKRLLDDVSARPAAVRVEDLRRVHAAAFKPDMDDAARAVMFRHLKAA